MRIVEVDPAGEIARSVLSRYGSEMQSRYGNDAPYGPNYLPEGVASEGGVFFVVLDGPASGEVAIGCGALRLLDATTAEVKSMFVEHGRRNEGIGKALLSELEETARSRGCSVVRLNTGAAQPEALGLYRASSYSEIAAYNENPYAAHWFERRLI